MLHVCDFGCVDGDADEATVEALRAFSKWRRLRQGYKKSKMGDRTEVIRRTAGPIQVTDPMMNVFCRN